jgi:hypothetical protein
LRLSIASLNDSATSSCEASACNEHARPCTTRDALGNQATYVERVALVDVVESHSGDAVLDAHGDGVSGLSGWLSARLCAERPRPSHAPHRSRDCHGSSHHLRCNVCSCDSAARFRRQPITALGRCASSSGEATAQPTPQFLALEITDGRGFVRRFRGRSGGGARGGGGVGRGHRKATLLRRGETGAGWRQAQSRGEREEGGRSAGGDQYVGARVGLCECFGWLRRTDVLPL